MNLIIFGTLVLIGWFAFFQNINTDRNNKLISFFLVILFIVTSISRLNGYHDYSDLGVYIWRFQVGDNAYFGKAYSIYTGIVRSLFGTNEKVFMGVLAALIASLAILSIYQWDRTKKTTDLKKNNIVFLSTFLFVFLTYWGLCFSTEVIRTGIAISFSLCALAFAKNKKIIISCIFFLLAIAFHWTEIFILPFVILLFLDKVKDHRFDANKYYLFILLVVVLDFVDLSYLLAVIIKPALVALIELFGKADHYLYYVDNFGRGSHFEFLTLQYIYYRAFACVLVYLYKRTFETKKIILYSYFMGLLVFSIMNSFIAVTRMQWIFAAPSVFLLYDYVKYGKDSKSNKLILISGIMLLQSVMAVNYLK